MSILGFASVCRNLCGASGDTTQDTTGTIRSTTWWCMVVVVVLVVVVQQAKTESSKRVVRLGRSIGGVYHNLFVAMPVLKFNTAG